MRGRSMVAALVAAVPVLLFGALVVPPAVAQDNPAAEADDPNAGGPEPADQQTAAPDAAVPAAADPSAETAAPAHDASPASAIEHDTVGIPKNAEIIAYCGGPQCPQSTQAAQKLGELGYTNVRTFKEGLEGWKAGNRATETLQEPVPAA